MTEETEFLLKNWQNFSTIRCSYQKNLPLVDTFIISTIKNSLWKRSQAAWFIKEQLMSKKVLIISTSLRSNSNSDALAKAFAKGAKEAGHQVTEIS